MNEDIRLGKYEIMIEDINEKLKTSGNIFSGILKILTEMYRRNELELIFDYNSCNEKAKWIIKKVEFNITSDNGDPWNKNYVDIKQIRFEHNVEKQKSLNRQFIQCCRGKQNISEKYKFIFWALMILTVDKNNFEEYLSLICDFSVMLGISEEEFEDIIQVIKEIYNKKNISYRYKTKIVKKIFAPILELKEKHRVDKLIEKYKELKQPDFPSSELMIYSDEFKDQTFSLTLCGNCLLRNDCDDNKIQEVINDLKNQGLSEIKILNYVIEKLGKSRRSNIEKVNERKIAEMIILN